MAAPVSGFRRATRKLPCRTQAFACGSAIDGWRIRGALSITKTKTVFELEDKAVCPPAVLVVRHSGKRLDQPLLEAAKANTPGLVRTLRDGSIDGNWYTIDEKLSSLSDVWRTFSREQQKTCIRQMAAAINALHDLGYCHLDVKPQNFALDAQGRVRLLDLDSALPYQQQVQENSRIEYTPEYAGPEIYHQQYSTASDFFSLGKTLEALQGTVGWGSWQTLIRALTRPDIQERMNYPQLERALNEAPNGGEETRTGPRPYRENRPRIMIQRAPRPAAPQGAQQTATQGMAQQAAQGTQQAAQGTQQAAQGTQQAAQGTQQTAAFGRPLSERERAQAESLRRREKELKRERNIAIFRSVTRFVLLAQYVILGILAICIFIQLLPYIIIFGLIVLGVAFFSMF